MLQLDDLPIVAVAAAALLITTPLAGCLDVGGDEGNPALALDAVAQTRTTAPGGAVAFPLSVGPNATNVTDANLTVEVVDAGSLETNVSPPAEITANGTGVFLTVSVPDDASTGDKTVTVRASAGEVVGPTKDLTVTVEEPDEVVEPGDQVSVDYTARFPNGTVFATSVEAVDAAPFEKAGFYQAGPDFQPLNITVGPDARFIEGFNTGVQGVGVGHDATFSVPPWQAYGNETTEGNTSRTETLDRTITQERETPLLDRDAVEQQTDLNDSSEEGDHITIGEPPNQQTYNITFLNETKVQFTLVVEEGDVTTHYQQWPNSSEAVHVNDTHVEYYVTPTVEENETFTWHDYWPDATKIVSLTNETIVLEHSPEVGTTYQTSGGLRGQASEQTVVELTEDQIIYEEENTHPLAGATLVFDVTVLSAQESSGQQRTR